MEPVAIRILYFAVLAAWLAVSSATAAETPQYGGFSSDADSLQVFYDYIHGQEMIKVEAGDELRSAIDSIPVDLGTAIDLEQEAGLRDWLYDLLVAFSASGNDSLAAAFYLREGFNNPDLAAQMIQEVERRGLSIGDTDTPFAFFRLAWDPEKAIWRHVEIYFSQGVPQDFLFNIM